jgi:hypothetical protein
MPIQENAESPPLPSPAKEPWETPRVIESAIKEDTGNADDTNNNSHS